MKIWSIVVLTLLLAASAAEARGCRGGGRLFRGGRQAGGCVMQSAPLAVQTVGSGCPGGVCGVR